MKPAATLSCAMARTFAQWTKNELVPSARRRYFSGVATIHQGSSYSCRKIADSRGVLSEHGKGNALDIMRIELNNGKDIDVRKPGLFAFRRRGLPEQCPGRRMPVFQYRARSGIQCRPRQPFPFRHQAAPQQLRCLPLGSGPVAELGAASIFPSASWVLLHRNGLS